MVELQREVISISLVEIGPFPGKYAFATVACPQRPRRWSMRYPKFPWEQGFTSLPHSPHSHRLKVTSDSMKSNGLFADIQLIRDPSVHISVSNTTTRSTYLEVKTQRNSSWVPYSMLRQKNLGLEVTISPRSLHSECGPIFIDWRRQQNFLVEIKQQHCFLMLQVNLIQKTAGDFGIGMEKSSRGETYFTAFQKNHENFKRFF